MSEKPYSKPFFITGELSNNAFSYERRQSLRKGGSPKIYVADLIEAGFNDVTTGTETAFEDFDDEGILHSCSGLKHFVKTDVFAGNREIPVYIFDNHNHAFYFWMEGFNAGILEKGATLIHVDQHKDARKPDSYLDEERFKDPAQVFAYVNSALNVGNFIDPALKTGHVKNLINIDNEYSVWNYRSPDANSIILDIDLDFFAPEMDYIDNESKIQLLKNLVPAAKMITVATSPYFIDQELAIDILKRIF